MSPPRPRDGLRPVPDEASVPGPSHREHRTTPEHVLECVYEVLGRPVGIDPCAHDQSLVDARRIVQPPENGLEVSWVRYETGFVAPPPGKIDEPRWIHKAIQEAAGGWEGVLLLPAHTGAPWFEALYAHAPCICFWGSPSAEVEGRIWRGEEDGAFPHTQFVYLGPRYEAFARVFAQVGHLVYPRHNQTLTTRISGHTMVTETSTASPSKEDLLRHAERRYHAGRHDPWIQATDELPPDMRVCDLPTTLRSPIESLTVHELRSALLQLGQGFIPTTASAPKRPIQAPEVDRRQIRLDLYEDGRVYHNDAERDRFDASILELVRSARKPVGRSDIMATCPSTENEYRGAIKRLKEADLVEQVGRGKRARYRAKQPPRTEQDDHQTTPGPDLAHTSS